MSVLAIAPRVALSQTPSPTPSPTTSPSVEAKTFERLEYRSIGPANMGGRTADVEGIPGNPNVVYAATASGGLWKTTNGGTTWRPIFERQGTISIGDIALDPQNPDVVWVGTGESNTRNSVSFGDGVYKSPDGGRTWQHMGLRDSERISRIVIHPRNSDVVYVGALGHAFGPNDERGVFMTTDGGKTWSKTLFVDREHGIADLDIDPANPNILYAAVWRFERKPWVHISGSEKGGVFKSIDGGRTWNKLTTGLPKMVGRIGVKVAPSNPSVVYAITEAKEGTLYRSDDSGENWRRVTEQANIVSRGFYYTDMRVDPTNENKIYAVASTLFVSIDGGRTFRSITGRTHIDYHALWIDPQNPRRMWQGQDGGIAVSHDAGETWAYVNNMPLGQFYQIHADNRQPFYHIVGGLQDNGTWSGPSRTREPAGILNDDWRMVSFGDGFYALNHADDAELYLTESQGGNVVRTDMRTREQQAVIPSIGVGGPASEQKVRFNWNSPLIQSPHDKNTVFLGGSVVFKSTDFGKSWQPISPDLTTNDREKQKDGGGPIAIENTTAEYHTTIISIAESPLRAGHIWVGTDDGNVQLTTDGGKNWTNLTKNVAGLAPNSPVSHVEPSRTSAEVAYASFDRHMLDDFRPYVFKTTDGGRTWTNISGNLPEKAHVWVVREDPKNTNLLYAGTELGLYATYDGGRNWFALNLKNLPNVAVHDILIHPRENDLILATHGRSVWIFDDATPLQQMTPELLGRDAHLFGVRPALRFTTRFTRYGIGDAVFTGPNPPYGALITYYLKEKPDAKSPVKLQILDDKGKVVTDLARVSNEKGLNRVSWDLRYGGPQVRRPPTAEETAFFGGPRGPQVLPGAYTVKLTHGGKTYEQKLEVRLDPMVNVPAADLQTAHDMGLKLRDMQTAANNSLRTLDSLKEQLQYVEKTIKDRMPDAPKDLLEKLTATSKQIEELQNKVARPPQQGLGAGGGRAQLADRLGGLFFAVDGTNAAPTPAQREAFALLQTEFRERMPEVNRFIAETIPQLNDALRKANAPTLIPGKPIEAPPM
ncbi:MAG: WD40/YVTN/BNR-like repeat-containing protein [Pyrinomonadaceae bacterium]